MFRDLDMEVQEGELDATREELRRAIRRQQEASRSSFRLAAIELVGLLFGAVFGVFLNIRGVSATWTWALVGLLGIVAGYFAAESIAFALRARMQARTYEVMSEEIRALVKSHDLLRKDGDEGRKGSFP